MSLLDNQVSESIITEVNVSISDEIPSVKNVTDELECSTVELTLGDALNNNKAITSQCKKCLQSTSKKDRSILCSECKNLVHFECTNLPAYTILNLKSRNRKYTCDDCTDTPVDFCAVNVSDENSSQYKSRLILLQDIDKSLQEIVNGYQKVDIQTFVENVDKKISTIENILESKFKKW